MTTQVTLGDLTGSALVRAYRNNRTRHADCSANSEARSRRTHRTYTRASGSGFDYRQLAELPFRFTQNVRTDVNSG